MRDAKLEPNGNGVEIYDENGRFLKRLNQIYTLGATAVSVVDGNRVRVTFGDGRKEDYDIDSGYKVG